MGEVVQLPKGMAGIGPQAWLRADLPENVKPLYIWWEINDPMNDPEPPTSAELLALATIEALACRAGHRRLGDDVLNRLGAWVATHPQR